MLEHHNLVGCLLISQRRQAMCHIDMCSVYARFSVIMALSSPAPPRPTIAGGHRGWGGWHQGGGSSPVAGGYD
jgi:hypothetical protein